MTVFLSRFSILSLLFPPKCPVCRERREKNQALCPKCLSEYQKEKHRPCKRCGKKSCRCACTPPADPSCAFTYLSVFHYDEKSPGGRMLLKLKDKKSPQITAFLAKDMANSLQNGCILRSDALVTFAPRSPDAVLDKGTDQAQELSRALADLCALEQACTLKNLGGKRQKTLSAKQRLQNANARFALSKSCPDLQGRQVILIDDILTSGATLSVCAQILKSKGAAQIVCLTAGRR